MLNVKIVPIKIVGFTAGLILLSVLCSCTKHVEGYVYKSGTLTGIENAHVYIAKEHHGNTGTMVANVYTDASGYYKISYKGTLFLGYRYTIYCYGSANNYSLGGKHSTANFYK